MKAKTIKRSATIICAFLLSCSAIGFANNPIIPNQGLCDPHIHIFNGKAYLFATHDEKPGNTAYTMNDWWLWSSSDLINWTKEFTLNPANTYIGPWNKCYATDGATRNGKYYFYFSKHSLNTGVAISTTGPGGPYADALGKQLTSGWDPTVYIDDDAKKTPYIIFGGFPYKIAKLNEDMISFAETPQVVTYENIASWTSSSDGNFIHKHNGLYYLNQHGQKYGTSTNIYGPYTFRGKYFPSWNDHGTFFTWNNQDYLAYGLGDVDNFYRKTNLTYVYYKDNGDLIGDTEVASSSLGVGQYDSKKTIQAEWYFAASDGTSKNENTGGFELRNLGNNSYLYYPNIRNIAANTLISFRVSSANSGGGTIELREGSTTGTLLGSCAVPNTGSWTSCQTISCTLTNSAGDKNIYLVFKGTGTELMRLDYFMVQNAGGNLDAFSQIEAEDYSSMSGVQKESCTEGGQNIGWIENGDYIVFNNVNFGTGAASFDARISSGAAGGSIEVRLDGISGTLVGTCAITGTGGWQTWTTKSCTISGVSGLHNLYLKFTGGAGYLFNMNWLKFTASSLPNVTALTGWVSGTTNTKVAGSNRLMAVMLMGESTGDFSATGVTYGGQAMTRQTEKIYHNNDNRTFASIFTLNEAGVNAASSGTIAVSWSPTPSVGNSIYSVLLGSVDQTAPVSEPVTNSLTGTTVNTSALSAASGDMVIMCGATETNNTVTFNNSFTKQFDSNESWGNGVGGNKVGSGASETPGFTQSASGCMVLCALVVKKSAIKTSSTERFYIGNSTGNNVNVYPNPVAKILYINCADTKSVTNIKIFNTHGQMLYNKQASGSITEVDVKELKIEGLVLVQVSSGQDISTFKVSVVK